MRLQKILFILTPWDPWGTLICSWRGSSSQKTCLQKFVERGGSLVDDDDVQFVAISDVNSFVVVVEDDAVALRQVVVVLAFLAFAPPPSMLHLTLYFRSIGLLLMSLFFTYYTQTFKVLQSINVYVVDTHPTQDFIHIYWCRP